LARLVAHPHPPSSPTRRSSDLPGFTGGVNDLDAVAAAVTEAGSGRIEVWCIERRNNRLEDARGMELAEAAGDPRLALGYYFACEDRKSTRLNSSHQIISYAVFC